MRPTKSSRRPPDSAGGVGFKAASNVVVSTFSQLKTSPFNV
jgi:hypothetical protein